MHAPDFSSYANFTAPYNYNINLELTPFHTEYLENYMDVLIDINLTTLQEYATDGYIKFSHVVFSVPNPAYELTINEVAIIQKSQEFFCSRISCVS